MIALFAVISLILGLHFLKDNLFVSIGLTLLFVIFIIYRFRWKKSVLFLTLFLCGALFANMPHVYNNPNQIYSGVVVSSKQNYFIFYSHGERFYVYEKENDREIGDLLKLSGTPKDCDFATYESQMDFNSYLANKGVRRSLSMYHCAISLRNPFRIHSQKSSFLRKLNTNAAPLADAMLFNTKDYSSDVISRAETLNIIFLMSTTGIYFSFFLRSLKKLLSFKFEDRKCHFLSLIIVSPYVLLSFPKVGVLRVFLINLFGIPKKDGDNKRSLSFLTKLSISHLILLLFNPYWAYDSGFLIGLFLTTYLYFFRLSYRVKMNWKSHLVTPALVFLLIQPFSSFRSGTFHLFTFFFQMALIPVNEIFIVFTFIGFIGLPITSVIDFFGDFIYEVMGICEKIDLKIPIYDYGDLYVGLFYVLAVVGLYLFEAKRYRHLRYLGYGTLTLLMIGLVPIQPMIQSGVYFINVGQGDAILIQDHHHAVMIDTGGQLSFDMAEETLIPFLNRKQIYNLDALVTTHEDFDHSGAANSLMNHFNVKNYLRNESDFPYSVGKINLINLNHYEAKNENDSSLVLSMDFYGRKYLFTGDAPKEIEKKIIKDNPDLTCDILKVGHHGSNTSTDESFIQQLRPKEAIISCGRRNKYGHPNQEVLDTLNRYDVRIRRTDQEGTISYLSYFAY